MELLAIKEAAQQAKVWFPIVVFSILFAWETISPYMSFKRPKGNNRLAHTTRNIFFAATNALIIALLFSGLWFGAAFWSEETGFGLFWRLGLTPAQRLIGAILVLDFWTYWWHYMNHRIPFFWRFHAVHHSDSEMDVTTAYRFHQGEITFSSLFRILILPVVGIELWHLLVYEVLLFAVVQFHHANIGLPEWLDKGLRLVIPTPHMHKVHHSTNPKEFNSNFTSLFSIWDRLFGTFRLSEDPHNIQFGLEGCNDPGRQTIVGLEKAPFERPQKND